MSRPTLTLIAGANGSGKTTLTRWNSELFREIPVLDPDTIGKTLQSTTSAAFPITGARQVLASAAEHLKSGRSFAVETTLSGKNYLFMMAEARRRGFEIVLVYIGTELSRSTWNGSETECLQEGMTYLRLMSGAGTFEA